MTGQLDLLPALEAPPAPHRYQPLDVVSGLGPCSECGARRLDEVHARSSGSLGVARFFNELDREPRERLGRTREVLQQRLDDLTQMAAADQHARDASFTAGLAWGIAALRLAQHTANGERGPIALPLPARPR